MRNVIEKNIDGTDYTITMLPADKAVILFTRLTKLIGKPLSNLVASGGMDAEVSGKLIGLCIEGLSENLDEEVVLKTIKDLLASTMVGNQMLDKVFNVHFAGRIGHLFKVVWAVLEVQYKDFLEGLGGLNLLSRIPKKEQE